MKHIAIETERLRLRPSTEADIPALHKLWTHPNVRAFLWDDVVITEQRAREAVLHSVKSFEEEGAGVWVVLSKKKDKLVGFCGLGHYGKQPEKELLYGIDPLLWGNGFATEVSQAMVRYAFEELHCPVILAGADPLNEASFRVIDKLGMQFVRRVQAKSMKEEMIDIIYYGIKREDFQVGDAFYELVQN